MIHSNSSAISSGTGFDTYTEKPGRTWPADLAFSEVDPEQYAALVIPGGRAPEYLRGNKDCQLLAQHFVDSGKPIAALCHGPLILAAVGALEGRTSSAYPALEPDLAAAGARWVDSPDHVDGVIVTGRAWPDHPQWMRAFLKVLREVAPA